MNKGLIIGLSVVVAFGGIVAYRYFIPPTFLIRSYTPSTHSGEFEFGGVSNHFGNSKGVVGGRMGWEVETIMNNDGTTTFNLRKKGKFIKELARK